MLVPGCAILDGRARSMLARGTTRGLFEDMFPPCKGGGFLRPCRRTSRFRNPGRCPGLECGGAFSAGINVVQIRIHES